MKFVLFYHSFVSCWNHGNAHFLRGLARELIRLGHTVTVYEPEDGWSRLNALRDGGSLVLDQARLLVPDVEVHSYRLATLDLDSALEQADVVIVHEWNDPALIARLGERRRMGGQFVLLFHDTHHRAVSAPHEMERFELDSFDGVLAFGEVLREMYLKLGWGRHVFTWHEAADTELFRPLPGVAKQRDLVWIGNWGDDERDRELHEFLIEPIMRVGLQARVHGVRFPDRALESLRAGGIDFGGWLPNHRVPEAFAQARMTVHVPRRYYVSQLPGVPTIRMFEALACGIPLVSAPWNDAEGLFPPGSYLSVANADEASAAMRRLLQDPELAAEIAANGCKTIQARHRCAHRARELLAIVERLATPQRGTPVRASINAMVEQ